MARRIRRGDSDAPLAAHTWIEVRGGIEYTGIAGAVLVLKIRTSPRLELSFADVPYSCVVHRFGPMGPLAALRGEYQAHIYLDCPTGGSAGAADT